jgi:hypothetical protein
VALAPEQRRVGLRVEGVAVAGMTGDRADARRERHGQRCLAGPRFAIEAGSQQPPDRELAPLRIGAGHDDRELIAADPEGPVGATQVAGHRHGRLAEKVVTDRVAARVVDALEVVEVEQGQGQWLAGADGARPLALHLLLECPVIAETGQRVTKGLGASPVVRVLQDSASALEALGGLEDPA